MYIDSIIESGWKHSTLLKNMTLTVIYFDNECIVTTNPTKFYIFTDIDAFPTCCSTHFG